jgi:hypothetical protein
MGQPMMRANVPAAAFIRCGLKRKIAECPGSSSLRNHPHAIVKIQMKAQNPTRVRRRRCPKPKWVQAPAKAHQMIGSTKKLASDFRTARSSHSPASSRAKKAIGKACNCRTNRVKLASTLRVRRQAMRLRSSWANTPRPHTGQATTPRKDVGKLARVTSLPQRQTRAVNMRVTVPV